MEIIKSLLRNPNTDTNVSDKEGNTPLMLAVRDKKIDLLKELLKRADINPNIANLKKEFPLIRAINDNNMEIIKLLLQHPNIDLSITDTMGHTPLIIAVLNKHKELVEELEKHPKLNPNKPIQDENKEMEAESTPISFSEIQQVLTSYLADRSNEDYLETSDFIVKTIDYILESADAEEKQEILKLLKPLSIVSYDKVDENGISVIEKILNSEDFNLLELLEGKELKYNRELDYTFNRIENDEFKKEVLNLKFTFNNLVDAINKESTRSLEKCKYQFESPLFSATKNGTELWDMVRSHWDNKIFVSDFINKYYKYCSE